jgi:hypothetical protein
MTTKTPPQTNRPYGVNLIRNCADGARPIFSMDDASQLDGIWKFKDRIEDRLSIALPNSPE